MVLMKNDDYRLKVIFFSHEITKPYVYAKNNPLKLEKVNSQFKNTTMNPDCLFNVLDTWPGTTAIKPFTTFSEKLI